jgi:hypothetical protein
LEEGVFAACFWVTHATVERVAGPRLVSLVATQRRGEHISAAVSRHAAIAAAFDVFCAVERRLAWEMDTDVSEEYTTSLFSI